MSNEEKLQQQVAKLEADLQSANDFIEGQQVRINGLLKDREELDARVEELVEAAQHVLDTESMNPQLEKSLATLKNLTGRTS